MKRKRQSRILEMVNEYQIQTQEELAELLRKEGFAITQATVSRDIRELHLVKQAFADKKLCYRVMKPVKRPSNEKYIRVLQDSFVSMDMAQNILVIKTVSGMAMAAAAALDECQFPELIGCIAGDDTIMCAVKSVQDTVRIMSQIKELLFS